MKAIVEFTKHGKQYVYDSGPFHVKIGNQVVVNVYGDYKIVRVVNTTNRTDYTGEIKSIVGIVTMDTDILPNQVTPKTFPTQVYVVLAIVCTFVIQYVAKEYSMYLTNILEVFK